MSTEKKYRVSTYLTEDEYQQIQAIATGDNSSISEVVYHSLQLRNLKKSLQSSRYQENLRQYHLRLGEIHRQLRLRGQEDEWTTQMSSLIQEISEMIRSIR